MPVFEDEDDAAFLLDPIRKRARQLQRKYEGRGIQGEEDGNEADGLSEDEAAGLSEDESDVDEESRGVTTKAHL